MKLTEINAELLDSFYNKLKQPSSRKDGKNISLSGQTAMHHHRLISAILEKAFKWGYINFNPAKRATPPKVKKYVARVYDEDMLVGLLAGIDNEPLKYKCIVYVALFTGLRRSEIMGLEWKNIDFKARGLRVQQIRQSLTGIGVIVKAPKNEHSIRSVALPEIVIEVLKTYKKSQDIERESAGNLWKDSDFIFTQWNGVPLHPDTISKWFPIFLKKHNLPPTNFHALRHSHSSVLIASNINPKTVSERLGHANTKTTMNIYTHGLKSADRGAAEKLDQIFKK